LNSRKSLYRMPTRKKWVFCSAGVSCWPKAEATLAGRRVRLLRCSCRAGLWGCRRLLFKRDRAARTSAADHRHAAGGPVRPASAAALDIVRR
jgi:hypothetical protein